MKAKLFILYSSVFLLTSCAQIVPLSGGDQDIEPPKELESEPLNGSTYFSSKEITITFDEFIQLQNLQSQLVVSPYMENNPEVKVRGKKLIISIKDSLQPNTTYSLNFGNAIADITENNTIPNYKYVFSTGSYVDSLSYSGRVLHAFDLTPMEKTSVLLYTQFEDSVPYLERPRYIAMTDKEGNFEIGNIAHGTYKLFAIKDINANYLFDLPNEAVAFENEALTLKDSKANAVLHLFEEDASKQFVLSSTHKKFGEVKLILNQPTKQLHVEHFDPENSGLLVVPNPTKDTISVWAQFPSNLEKQNNYKNYLRGLEAFAVMDSNYVIDTITTSVYTKLEDTLLTFNTNIKGSIFDLNQPITLRAKYPLKQEVQWDELVLLEDSTPVNNFNYSLDDTAPQLVQIDYPFKEETNYELVVPKGLFTSIYGTVNDSLGYQFKTKSQSDYGKIMLDVTPNFEGPYIVQLIGNGKIVKEEQRSGSGKMEYDYVRPGNYQLKLIVDANNDGSWTTGNYLEGQQPEKVFFYQKQITIRANWDNEITWVISE